MKTVVLGGGLAGVMLAGEISGEVTVLEKNGEFGGLCRSFDHDGIACDLGPHILFSRNQTALDKLLSFGPTERIRRSNQIFHQGRTVKYPFENDLSALPPEQNKYCLQEFLSNPYTGYPAGNMLQFFLKTFGEGITRLYLQPYNEKIWKLDPSFIDTQMVERIPKPPAEDIIKSSAGESTEGYLHQLFFHYPETGGISSVVAGARAAAAGRAECVSGVGINRVSGQAGSWRVETDRGDFTADRLVNAMPLHELGRVLELPVDAGAALAALKYNSIHIIAISAKRDNMGDNFAFFIADKDVIFHRLSKMNFLGKSYCRANGGSTLQAEITFRPDSYLGGLGNDEIVARVLDDLDRIGLVSRADVLSTQVRTEKYAYVIYDLDHRKNKKTVVDHLAERGIACCGRFAEFEYYNMDKIAERVLEVAAGLNSQAR